MKEKGEFKIEYDNDLERKIKEWTPIRYLDTVCPKCDRNRVELFASGKKVCEKCSTNYETLEFESEHWCVYHNA